MIKRIGRYEVQAELGRGGFGQVFRAYDPGVGRLVAIKTLTVGNEPDMLARFRNEAGATGKLRHPNIIVVYDFGEQDGAPYLVMELLEGEDLERILSSGRRLTLLESVYVMTQVGSGLHHAHVNGIVHRDVKPANIMMLPNGTVKIMDFGIALLMQATAARITPQGSLIGTFPYMAPEQFYGMASDALTDIFAYGVTFYKALTGTHPFQASEMAGVMFNIVNKTPASIRELNPECPEALEEAVFKALAKDRDSRYQSLEDVLFDLEPIVVELRRARTTELIAEAREQIATEQFDAAQSFIKQALEIDPVNRTARELRERLQGAIKERNLRPRIAALLDQGREQLRARQYNEAIQKFESALRLDQSSSDIRALIEEARAAWESAQRSERLLKEGYRAFESGDLTAAYKSISDALSISPDDPDARGLLESISSQIEDRNRTRRLSEVLNRARGLILLQNFDESIQMLRSLRPEYPESSELLELLARATQEREAQARMQRLQAAVRETKDLLQQRRFTDALARLSTLIEEYPESAELRELSFYAREESKAQQQIAAVAAVSSEVKDMVASGQLDAAIERIRGALVEHPAASALREALQAALSAKAERERSTALEATAKDVRRLLGTDRFSEGLDRISSFTQAYGEAAVLDSLRRTAEDGLEKQRRIMALRNLLLEGQGLLDQGRPETASEFLEQATIDYPGDPNLTRLFGVAQNKLHEQQQAEAISKSIENSEMMARSGQFDNALAALDTGLRQFPGNNRLLRCKDAILAQRARRQRERLRKEALERVTRLSAEGSLGEAADALQQTVALYGGDQEISALQRDIAAAAAERERRQEIDKAVGQAQALLDDGNPSLAVQHLRAAVLKYPEAAEKVKALLALAEERYEEQRLKEIAADVAAIRAAAQQHLENGQFEEALQLLAGGLEKYPGRKEIADLREEVLAAREAHARQAALNSTAGEIRERRNAGQLEDALEAAAAAGEKFGGEPVLIELRFELERDLDAVRAQRARDEHERLRREAMARVTQLRAEGNLEDAAAALQQAVEAFGEDQEAAALQRDIAAAAAERERRQEIDKAIGQAQALLEEGNPSSAAEQLREAVSRYPEAADKLKTLLGTAEEQYEEQRVREREAEIAADVAAIRAAAQHHLEKTQFEEALQLLDSGLAKYPGRKEINALREGVLAAREAHARKAALSLARDEISQRRHAGRLEDALNAATAALVQFGEEPLLIELRIELERDLEAFRAQRARDERERLRREAFERVTRLSAEGNLKEAAAALRQAVEVFGEDQETAALKRDIAAANADRERRQAVDKAIEQAQALLEEGNPSLAVQQLREAVSRYAQVADRLKPLLALAEEQSEEKRLKDIAADIAALRTAAQQHLENGHFEDALQLLNGGLEKYPGRTEIVDLRKGVLAAKEVHARQAALAAVCDEIRAGRRDGRLESALKAAAAALEKFGDEPVLIELRIELERDLEAVRRAERLQSTIRQIKSLLAQGEPRAAGTLMQLAVAEYGEEPELARLRAEIDQAIERQRQDEEIRLATEKAQALAEALRFGEAYAVLDVALAAHPDQKALLSLRDDLRGRQARIELLAHARGLYASGDLQPALERVELGLRQSPQDREWLGLKGQITRDRQKQLQAEARHKALESAETCFHEERCQDGVAILDEAVRQLGAWDGATTLRRRLQEQIDEQRRAAARKRNLEELSAIRRELDVEPAKRKLKALDRQAAGIAALYPRDDEFARLALEITARAQSQHPAPTLLPWKRISAAAAALVLVTSIALVFQRFHRPAAVLIATRIQTDPQGATVRLGDRSCVTPSCAFQLPPGEYQLEASLSGYREIRQVVKIDPARPPRVIDLTLDPVPAPATPPSDSSVGSLVVRAGVPRALVTVDGVPRGRTDQQGGLTVPLPAAVHEVQVGKAGYDPVPAQRIRVAQGSSQNLAFNMTPQPARQEIPGATSGGKNPGGDALAGANQGATATVPQPAVSAPPTTVQPQPSNPEAAAASQAREQNERQARAAELDWSNVNREDAQSLQAFVNQYPDGPHRLEAQTLLDRLGERKAEAKPKIEPQPAAQETPPQSSGQGQPSPRQELEGRAIRAALDQFNEAFQAKQPRDLKRIWPAAPGQYTKAMQLPGTTYLMTLRPVAEAQIANDTASILCELSTKMTIRGQATDTRKQVVVLFHKSGDAWVIVDPFSSAR